MTAAEVENSFDLLPGFPESNTWQSDEYVFRLISEDSTLMQRGLPTDIQVEEFYQRISQHNIAFYEDIRGLLGQENYAQAIYDLMNIQPESELEADLTQVYSVLPVLLEKDDAPVSADTLSLQDIAYKLSAVNGAAAFMARAILNLELDDEIIAPLLKLSQENKLQSDGILIFPNPSKDNLTIKLLATDYDVINEIELFEITGSRILKVYPNSSDVNLSLPGIENGIYVISIKSFNGKAVRKMQLVQK